VYNRRRRRLFSPRERIRGGDVRENHLW
jgi:hypothetical protein